MSYIDSRYMFVLVCLLSCNNHSKPLKKSSEPKLDSLELNEKLLDNDFLKIALSFCEDQAEFKYTNKNTTCFDLNVVDPLNCFVVASQLICGHPMGSCGEDINIYKKTCNGYSVIFNACGLNIKQSIESNEGIYSFTYDNRDGFTKKVVWTGKLFEEDSIRIHGLNYAHIKQIADILKTNANQFRPEDFDNPDHEGSVKIESIRIGNDRFCELYQVKSGETHFFIIENNTILFHIDDILALETIADNTKKYYDLKVHDIKNYTVTNDTSFLNPVYYSYLVVTKKYRRR